MTDEKHISYNLEQTVAIVGVGFTGGSPAWPEAAATGP